MFLFIGQGKGGFRKSQTNIQLAGIKLVDCSPQQFGHSAFIFGRNRFWPLRNNDCCLGPLTI